MQQKLDYDVSVIGGGMIGGATAIGLAQLGLRVALFDAASPDTFSSDQPPDLRVSAINMASQQLLQSLGVWKDVAAMRVHPYQRMAVWERTGVCEFSAEELGTNKLGYFVENRLLQIALHRRAESLNNISLFPTSPIKSVSRNQPCEVTLQNEERIRCNWVIAADGANSKIRQQANIGTTGWKYNQQVLALTVKLSGGENDITWQRFAPTGPQAFLPMYDEHAALVWYHQADRVKALKELPTQELKHRIVREFPDRLADFEILNRGTFPIQRLHASSYSRGDLLLIGDAAHSINPLAGQGVNLGFKDLKVLLDLVHAGDGLHNQAGRRSAFRRYERRRRYDNLLMMSAMDALYASFSNDITPLRWARNQGLRLANRSGLLKKKVLKYAAGIN